MEQETKGGTEYHTILRKRSTRTYWWKPHFVC